MPLAQSRGWLLAAPTFAYGDWLDPAKLRSEDLAFEAQLTAMTHDASARTGRELRPRVFLVGFSRGAQLASRFALFHPDRVAAVASMSAGAYTIPSSFGDINGDGVSAALALPYGTGDMASVLGYPLDNLGLRQVSFLVTCGGDDNSPGDVPRQWDGLLGKNRLARAQAFHQALLSLGVPTQLVIFPRVKHQVTAAMTEGVGHFLGGI
jgi:pimeloyl-ACP methyl ester carboxylesterase